jgi:hypothetical protein
MAKRPRRAGFKAKVALEAIKSIVVCEIESYRRGGCSILGADVLSIQSCTMPFDDPHRIPIPGGYLSAISKSTPEWFNVILGSSR